MNVEIKLLTEPEEFLQANINDAIAFNNKMNPDDEKNKEPEPFADTYGAFVDGKLVAGIYAHKYKMILHGKYVPMCGIGSVNTLIEHRNKRLIRRLMSAIFDDALKDGYVYSYLYPFSFRYYEKFGYGHGISNIRAEIPIERFEGHKFNFDVKMYRKGDSAEPYREVFEKFAYSYSGMVMKNAWEAWLDEFVPEKNHKSMFLFTENGTPRAYFGYENFYDKGGHLSVHGSAAWDSPESFKNILGFLYTLRMHNDMLHIVLPESFPLESMMPEFEGIKLERYMSGQARIIDVLSALKAYPWHNDEGSLIIGVSDDYFTEQSGAYRVNFGGGETDVAKCEGISVSPDIELDIRVLSTLLLGAYGYSDLEYTQSGPVSINNNKHLLEKVFARRNTFITERF